jgi:hypothetical protein
VGDTRSALLAALDFEILLPEKLFVGSLEAIGLVPSKWLSVRMILNDKLQGMSEW